MHHAMLNHADSLSIFAIALGMAFSHCYAMCGGIVLACAQMRGRFAQNLAAQMLYNAGRVLIYCAIGGVCAYLGTKIAVNNSTRGGIFVIAGIFMLCFGFGYLFLPRILGLFEPNIARFALFRRFFGALLKMQNMRGAFVLGILNGFLPCGVVYFFAMNAAISGSVLNGVKIMLIFGVASAIPLLLLGVFSAVLKLTRFKNAIAKMSAILIMLYGAWIIWRGVGFIFGD